MGTNPPTITNMLNIYANSALCSNTTAQQCILHFIIFAEGLHFSGSFLYGRVQSICAICIPYIDPLRPLNSSVQIYIYINVHVRTYLSVGKPQTPIAMMTDRKTSTSLSVSRARRHSCARACGCCTRCALSLSRYWSAYLLVSS